MKILKISILFLILITLCFCKKNTLTPYNPAQTASLVNSKWVLYQYKDLTMSNPQARNDTLNFISNTSYKWNQANGVYSLIDNGSGILHLTLRNTPFGDISGNVPPNFISNQEIVGAQFTQLVTSNAQNYNMWFIKVN